MGTFARYYGDMIIPDELKEEFNDRLVKLLNYGGMMDIEKVRMFGKEVLLLNPVSRENETVHFYYNYFEDSSWESARYDSLKRDLCTGKIGGQEFCDVILAGYALYELYTKGRGMTLLNGEIVDIEYAVGWINNLFSADFTLDKRFNLWDYVEMIAVKGYNDYGECVESEIKTGFWSLLPKYLMEYAGGVEMADICYIFNGTKSLTEESISPGTYPADVLASRQQLEAYFNASEDGEKKVDELWRLLKLPGEKRMSEEGALAGVASMTLKMPARMIVFLATEILEKQFWVEWMNLKDEVYRDEMLAEYAGDDIRERREIGRNKPIEKVRTSEYLYQNTWFTFHGTPEELDNEPKYFLSDKDRLYWWDGSDEVVIDEKTGEWLKSLADKYKDAYLIVEKDKSLSDYNFIPTFIKMLAEVDDYYNLKSRPKLNLQFQNLVFTRVHSISGTILRLCRVSFITLPKNAVIP